jgi:hypothetical protein
MLKNDFKNNFKSMMWNVPDDPNHDRIRDCVRATQYRGRTIEHAT